ncbi:MAG TPA: c-type cytochrome [Nitrospirota bacterium]|nr:c-type cytochrome [Nitrospirota bacterium]
MMNKIFIALFVVVVLCCTALYASAQKMSSNSGEALFAANCQVCHPNGGNIINPAKTLHQKDRYAHSVKTEADIVKIMRNPGPGMTKFDEKAISDKDAHTIAAYVIKTFSK